MSELSLGLWNDYVAILRVTYNVSTYDYCLYKHLLLVKDQRFIVRELELS